MSSQGTNSVGYNRGTPTTSSQASTGTKRPASSANSGASSTTSSRPRAVPRYEDDDEDHSVLIGKAALRTVGCRVWLQCVCWFGLVPFSTTSVLSWSFFSAGWGREVGVEGEERRERSGVEIGAQEGLFFATGGFSAVDCAQTC